MNLDPELILNAVINFGKVTYIWPLDSKAPKLLKVIHQLFFYFHLINMLSNISLILCTISDAVRTNNYYLMIEGVSHLGTGFEVLCNWSICKYQRKHFQELLNTLKKYVEKKNRPHKKVLQKYFNNYLSIHLFEIILYVSTVIGFMCSPFFFKNMFPLPFYFDIYIQKYSVVYYVIFIWHTLIMSFSTITIVLNLTTAMLISVITTKFDMLIIKIKAITNDDQLRVCIQKHQKYIRYAQALGHNLRFLILKVYITSMTTTIFGALPVLYYRNYIELIRSLLYIGTCLVIAYILAWAADDMRQAGLNVSQALYNSDWLKMPLKTQKSMVIMMCGAQKPLEISVSGILPPLTLKFYAQFLSFTLSYIMTLRVILF